MTRNEAMAFAISVGNILPQQEFWTIRSGGSWENGWEEYKED